MQIAESRMLVFKKRQEWLKPSPAPEDEIALAEKISPGDYEIFERKLQSIAEEGRDVLVRTGISQMIRSGDIVVGIFDREGDLVSGALGTFLHAVSSQLPIKYIVERYVKEKAVEVNEGDIFYVNDQLYGNIHNNDQVIIMPIFHDHELIAWASAAAHQAEVGSSEPGRSIFAHSRHEEGMLLPPIKFGENYKIREDLLEMTVNFVSRAPRVQENDIRARASAVDRVRIRIEELADEKGNEFIVGLFRKILMTAEQGARAKVSKWNDGKFRGTVFLDTVGHTESLLRTCCTLTKKGDHITLDFEGSSPEHDGTFHAFLHTIASHAAIYIFSAAFHDLPICTSTMAPIDFKIPDGTWLNAGPEAAMSVTPVASIVVTGLINSLFSKMMYSDEEDRTLCTAANGNTSPAYMFGGTNQWGVKHLDQMSFPLNSEGFGARTDIDGGDSFGFCHCPYGRAADVEDDELDNPHLLLAQKHLTDSSGAGRNRGGSGTQSIWVIHNVPQYSATSMGKTSKFPVSIGLFGGYYGCVLPGVYVANTDVLQKMLAGESDIPTDIQDMLTRKTLRGDFKIEHITRRAKLLKEGDIFVGLNSGGGGYGDALERPGELVERDLKNGIISKFTATNVYHISFDPETLALNQDETESLRKEIREKRLRNSMGYDDFVQKWSKHEPAPGALAYYGSWPEGKAVTPIYRA